MARNKTNLIDVKIVSIQPELFNNRVKLTFNKEHNLKEGDIFTDGIDCFKTAKVVDSKVILVKQFDPYIYMWTNTGYEKESIYKVGVTNWQTVALRVKQTDTTGVVYRPRIVASWKLSVYSPEQAFEIEKNIHNAIPNRVHSNREFFQYDPIKIKKIVENEIQKADAKFFKQPSAIYPYYYQSIGSDLAEAHFKINEKGIFHLACGTGKSYLSFWVSEKNRKHIKNKSNFDVILVPSRQLNKQIRDDWESVSLSLGKKFYSMQIRDGKENPSTIKAFINECKEGDTNAIFCCYQSINVLLTALEISNKIPDNIIYDEAHKIAGEYGKMWQSSIKSSKLTNLENSLNKKSKKIFFTATLKYVEGNYAFSMNNKDYFGDIIYQYTYKDAVEDGYVTPTRVIALETSNKKIKELVNKNKKVLAEDIGDENLYSQFMLAVHATLTGIKEGYFTHPLIYTNTVSKAEDIIKWCIKLAPEYGVEIEKTLALSGEDTAEERIKLLKTDFKLAKIAICASAKCLTEGISVDCVDGTVFADPKSSYCDIVQCIGRGCRLFTNKKFNTVVTPILLGDSLESTKYNKLYESILNFCMDDDYSINVEFKMLSKANSKAGIEFIKIKNSFSKKTTGKSYGDKKKGDNTSPDLLNLEDVKSNTAVKLISNGYKANLTKNQLQKRINEFKKINIDLQIAINNFDSKKNYKNLMFTKDELYTKYSILNDVSIDVAKKELDIKFINEHLKMVNELNIKIAMLPEFSSL